MYGGAACKETGIVLFMSSFSASGRPSGVITAMVRLSGLSPPLTSDIASWKSLSRYCTGKLDALFLTPPTYKRLRRHFFDEVSARQCSFQGALDAPHHHGLSSNYRTRTIWTRGKALPGAASWIERACPLDWEHVNALKGEFDDALVTTPVLWIQLYTASPHFK